MQGLVYFGFLLLIFTSCQNEEKIVYIRFDQSEGLSVGHPVLLNGVSVGSVLDVDIANDDYHVLAAVRLSDSLDFPKDTQFEIQSQDLFTKMIFVTIGESEKFLKNGDTIQGVLQTYPLQTPHHTRSPKLLKDVKEMLKN